MLNFRAVKGNESWRQQPSFFSEKYASFQGENHEIFLSYHYQRKFGCETSELRTFKNAQRNRSEK